MRKIPLYPKDRQFLHVVSPVSKNCASLGYCSQGLAFYKMTDSGME